MHSRIQGLVLLLAVGAAPVFGAPFIFYRGIVNAASFAPPGLANGMIARGSIFTIFGRDLGPAEAVRVSAFPLPNELAGVSIEVCREEVCSAAIPLFVQANQVNALMRSDAPLGPVSVRVTFNGEAGNFSPAEVVASSVGLFSVSSGGFGPGVVQNYLAADNQPINSPRATARRVQVVTLWGTGLGPGLNADNVAPQAGDLAVDVEIWVGNARVTNKLYSGRSPCCAGVDQLVFEIPQDAPTGCWVPIHVRTAGSVVSNGVTIGVGDGGACSDPHNPFQPPLIQGGKLAALVADHYEVHTDIPGVEESTDLSDWVQLYLREDRTDGFAFDRLLSWPPAGSCTTQALRGDGMRTPAPPSAPTVRWLDAGPLVTLDAGDERSFLYVDRRGAGAFAAGYPNEVNGLLLGEGVTAVVSTGGGDDLGGIEGSVVAGPALAWTNREAVGAIEAGSPLTLTWNALDPAGRLTAIEGVSVNVPNNVTGRFHCLADAAAGTFTVPGWATANLPAAEPRLFEANAALTVGLGRAGPAGDITADGLDAGVSVFHSWVGTTATITEAP